MRPIQLDVIMAGKLVTAKDVKTRLAAIQKQVHRDFAPVWGVDADIDFVGPPEKARPGAWQLVLLDEHGSDDCGFHELTREGLPLGKVYLKTAMGYASGWGSTASHEVLELLANPDTTFGVFVLDKSTGGRVYMREVCDACQDDRCGYEIDGVGLSDFVHPTWFDPWRKEGSARFDHTKKLSAPFQVLSGGYTSYFDTRKRKWIDVDGGREAPRVEPAWGYAGRGGSRRIKRHRARTEWRVSLR